MAMWLEAAKERIGEEELEKLMSMRGQMNKMWGNRADGRFGGRFPGFGREGQGHGHGMHGFGWPSRDGKNSPPDNSHDTNDK